MANMIDRLISIEASIINDIHYGVMKDVALHLELDDRTLRILHGALESGKSRLDSNAVVSNTDPRVPRTVAERTLTVTASEKEDSDYLGAMSVVSRNQFPIYADAEAGVHVAPIYVMKNYDYEFIYRSPSKTDIEELRTRIFRKLTRTENVIGHKVEYTMILPKSFLVFVNMVHSLRSKYRPETLAKYLENFAHKNLKQITDMSNRENIMLGIRESQERVIGVFEFVEEAPELDKDNDKGQYTLRFGYRLQLEVPNEISYNFPVMIFNQLIANSYIDILEASMLKTLSQQSTYNTSISETYNTICGFGVDRDYYRPYAKNVPIAVPVFDDQSMSVTRVSGYRTVMTILIQFDEDDPTLLVNLKDLGDWTISKDVLNYIKDNKLTVCSLYQDVLLFTIDAFGQHMGNDILYIDEELNLRSRKVLDVTKNHRVGIRVMVDPTYIQLERVEQIFRSESEIFDTFLTELAYANHFDSDSNSSTPVSVNIETLLGHLIRRIDWLLSRKNYDDIVTMIVALNESSGLSSALGKKLYFGYPLMMKRLYNLGICYLFREFYIWILSDDPRVRKGQIDEHEYLYRKNGSPSHGNQGRERQPHYRANPRTVMQRHILALRKGDGYGDTE